MSTWVRRWEDSDGKSLTCVSQVTDHDVLNDMAVLTNIQQQQFSLPQKLNIHKYKKYATLDHPELKMDSHIHFST